MPGKKSIFLGGIFISYFFLDFVCFKQLVSFFIEDAGIATHVVGSATHTIKYQLKEQIYTYVNIINTNYALNAVTLAFIWKLDFLKSLLYYSVHVLFI